MPQGQCFCERDFCREQARILGPVQLAQHRDRFAQQRLRCGDISKRRFGASSQQQRRPKQKVTVWELLTSTHKCRPRSGGCRFGLMPGKQGFAKRHLREDEQIAVIA